MSHRPPQSCQTYSATTVWRHASADSAASSPSHHAASPATGAARCRGARPLWASSGSRSAETRSALPSRLGNRWASALAYFTHSASITAGGPRAPASRRIIARAWAACRRCTFSGSPGHWARSRVAAYWRSRAKYSSNARLIRCSTHARRGASSSAAPSRYENQMAKWSAGVSSGADSARPNSRYAVARYCAAAPSSHPARRPRPSGRGAPPTNASSRLCFATLRAHSKENWICPLSSRNSPSDRHTSGPQLTNRSWWYCRQRWARVRAPAPRVSARSRGHARSPGRSSSSMMAALQQKNPRATFWRGPRPRWSRPLATVCSAGRLRKRAGSSTALRMAMEVHLETGCSVSAVPKTELRELPCLPHSSEAWMNCRMGR